MNEVPSLNLTFEQSSLDETYNFIDGKPNINHFLTNVINWLLD